MTTLRLQLLGPPLVWRDEQAVHFKTRKTLAVLIYLVLESGVASRERLAELLWPDRDPADARKNLRTALSYLRLALGDGALTTTHEEVSLNHAASLTIDLDLQVLARVQRLAHGDAEQHVADLRAQLELAVALDRGPFLAGLDIPGVPEFETWLAGQRAHWAGVMGELLERLAGSQAMAGDLGAARGTTERWVALEPGEERAWQDLLSLALDAGDLVGARRGWAACQAALADLGVAPGEPLQTLAQRIGAATHSARLLSPAEVAAACAGALGQAPLVGRAGPLALLRRAFARAQSGQAQLVVLQGEAGIGKTRLASEFLVWVQAQGADVLVGRAIEAEARLPYAPLIEGLRTRLERENAPDDLLSDLWLAELARLVPELRERYPDLPQATEDVAVGQGRLYEAVARLGQALAACNPLVLLLDDIQWVDPVTRDLVRYLLRRWADNGVRILVLLAVRVDGSDRQAAIDRWLRGLDCAATTWLDLERLADEEVVSLVAALAGDTPQGERPDQRGEHVSAFGRWLADTCAGVPFYVIRMLEALLAQGVLRLRPTTGDDWALDVRNAVHAVCTQSGDTLPAAIRAVVTAQVAHLEEIAAALLAAGTVLGDTFSAEQVLQVAEVEERSGECALDQLVRGKLLREAPEMGRFRVGHPLVREVLYAGLGPALRRRLHRRALAVLEAEGAPATELHRHALAAGMATPVAGSRVPAVNARSVVPPATTRVVREAMTGRIAAGVVAMNAHVAQADPAHGRRVALRAHSGSLADGASRLDTAEIGARSDTHRGLRFSQVTTRDQGPDYLLHQLLSYTVQATRVQLGALTMEGDGTDTCRTQRAQSFVVPVAHGDLRSGSFARPPPRRRCGARHQPLSNLPPI